MLTGEGEGTSRPDEGNGTKGRALPPHAQLRSHIIDAIGKTTAGYRSNLRPEEGEGDREAEADITGRVARPDGGGSTAQQRASEVHDRFAKAAGVPPEQFWREYLKKVSPPINQPKLKLCPDSPATIPKTIPTSKKRWT